MRYKNFFIVFFYSIGLLYSSLISSALAVEDAIIAVVNDELITLKDLKDYVWAVQAQLKMEGRYSEDEIKEIMRRVEENGIDRLIDDRIVLNAANERGIQAKHEAIDDELEKVKARYPSEQDFLNAISQEGMSISDLRKKLADQLKAQYLVEQIIKSQIQVNPQEVTNFYNAHPEKFKNPESVDLESVFIPLGDDPAESYQTAQEALRLLKSGQPFQDVASQFSSAPSVGKILRGQMKPEIETKIFTLKTGQISDIIENEQGYFIFKLNAKNPEQAIPLEDAKDQIAQYIFNQKFKEKMNTWLTKQKEKSFIEIKTP